MCLKLKVPIYFWNYFTMMIQRIKSALEILLLAIFKNVLRLARYTNKLYGYTIQIIYLIFIGPHIKHCTTPAKMRQYKSNSAGKLTNASEIITHDRRRDKLRRVISVGLFFALNQTVLGKRTLVCRCSLRHRILSSR